MFDFCIVLLNVSQSNVGLFRLRGDDLCLVDIMFCTLQFPSRGQEFLFRQLQALLVSSDGYKLGFANLSFVVAGDYGFFNVTPYSYSSA